MNGERKPAICFVTNELYPIGPGGIGRMLFNFVKHNHAIGSPADIHFVVPSELFAKDNAWESLANAFGRKANVHICPDPGAMTGPVGDRLGHDGDRQWTLKGLLATSFRYYQGVLEAERRIGRSFDVIEFPDFGGWALATLEAKRAGLAFADTLIAARLHSTQGLIYRAERFTHVPGSWCAHVFDAERHLLRYADLVISHNAGITTANRDHYDLGEKWAEAVIEEFPPILTDDEVADSSISVIAGGIRRLLTRNGSEDAKPEKAVVTLEEPDFIYSSRLQPFKRPDIFIRAAIAFLERRPTYKGVFRLVSYGWDQGYIERLRALIPDAFAERVLFVFGASSKERLEYLRKSIVVVPSDYESLCLFAFEAANTGCKVVLNRRCPSFAVSDRWSDQENCLMFDGTACALADVMEKAIEWTPTSIVDKSADRPYWAEPPKAEPKDRSAQPAQISAIFFGADTARTFQRQFASAALLVDRSDSLLDENVLFLLPRGVFDPSGDEAAKVEAKGWRVAFSSGLKECPEAFAARAAALPTECVLLCPAGFEHSPDFIEAAASAMGRDANIAIFGGQVEVVDHETGDIETLRGYGGEMPSLALTSNQTASVASIFRRGVFETFGGDPRAEDMWLEIMARRATIAQQPIVIAPMIAASLDSNYADRPDSTRRLNGGVLDQVGLEAGLPSRLLCLDLTGSEGDEQVRPTIYTHEDFRRATRLVPAGRVRDWEPISYNEDYQGLLVHPLKGTLTVAELRGPRRRLRKMTVFAKNAHTENKGGEVAVCIAPTQASAADIVTALKKREAPAGFVKSHWTHVGASKDCALELFINGVSRGSDRIIMASRVPSGGAEHLCHIVFTGIEFRHD